MGILALAIRSPARYAPREGDSIMYGLVGLVILVLDIIAIVDVLKSNDDTGKKLLWILLILFLPVVGMILYFLIGKK
jgi:hypothetical protein